MKKQEGQNKHSKAEFFDIHKQPEKPGRKLPTAAQARRIVTKAKIKHTVKKHNATLLVALSFLAIIITAIDISFLISANQPQKTSETPSDDASTGLDQALKTINEETSSPSSANDVSTVDSSYQKQIDAATSDELKAELYLNRALTLYNIMQNTENDTSAQVLSDLYAADNLNPTAYTADLISIYEGIFGNQEASEKYHDLALERSPDYFENQKKGRG